MIKRCIPILCVSALLVLPFALVNAAAADSETTTIEKRTVTSPTGTIVIDNESNRTFKLQGHTEVYTAPTDFDLPSSSGKEVTIYTDSNGKVTRIERKSVTVP